MPTVHHLNNSRSQRILWLLEELGVEYQIKRYERDPETMLAPDELAEVHPLGKAPVVTDGDRTVAESGAIIEYLVDEYDEDHRLRPAHGSEEFLAYRFWMHYAEGSAMPPMLLSLIVNRIETAPVPFFIKPVVKGVSGKIRSGFLDRQLRTHLDYMEAEISKTGWFAGDAFSAADIQMSFPIEAAQARGHLEGRSGLQDFLECIHARPAYQRGVERGGEYELMSGD